MPAGLTILTRTSTSQPISPSKQIASSGEGEVWETNLSGFLAKLYHSPSPERVKKLEVMVANPPLDPTASGGHISIAWPADLLRDSNGTCVGFLMPAIAHGMQLPSVYNPKLRQKKAPKFNWLYLHTAAQNVASIIGAIHAKGYVLGDIKPQNLLVNDRALVSVIDTDSFQVCNPQTGRVYHCTVGSEGFTPVELLSKDLSTVIQTEVNDRFRLAVIIYLLLFGNHPFQGKWIGTGESPEIDELIRRGFWPYAQGSSIQPSPTTIPLYVVHPAIKQCFIRCFNDGYINPDLRPTATDWCNALQLAIDDLKVCDREANHYYSRTYGRCCWCDRAAKLGVDIFATTPGKSATQASYNYTARSHLQPQPAPLAKLKSLNPLEKIIIAVGAAFLLGIAAFNRNSKPQQPLASTPSSQNQLPPEISPNPEDLQRLIATKMCPNCNLSKAKLQWADLSGANLSGADLSEAELSAANLSGADLNGANLIGANLNRANLSGANLSEADLSLTNFNLAYLKQANLNRANLRSAQMKAANLEGANLNQAQLKEADLTGASYDDSTQFDYRFYPTSKGLQKRDKKSDSSSDSSYDSSSRNRRRRYEEEKESSRLQIEVIKKRRSQ